MQRFLMEDKTLDWCPEAQAIFRNEAILNAPPQQVFDTYLADINAWPRWFGSEFISGTWTKGQGGVGSERTAKLKAITVSERFLAWDRPQDNNSSGRFAFLITSANKPLASAAIEDYRVEPAENGKTTFTWVVSVNFKWFVKPISILVKAKYSRLFRTATANLVRTIEEDTKTT